MNPQALRCTRNAPQAPAPHGASSPAPLGSLTGCSRLASRGRSFLAAALAFLLGSTVPVAGQEWQLLADLEPGTTSTDIVGPGSSAASIQVGSITLFKGCDGRGCELWVSDGSAPGTELLVDLVPGPSSGSPSGFVAFGGLVYFAASDRFGDRQLWRTDGTAGGTELFLERVSGVPVAHGGMLWFAGFDETHGFELWSSDGTAAGTGLLADVQPGTSGSFPEQFTGVGQNIFFAATTDDLGEDLWVHDPSDGTTTLVKDIESGEASSFLGQLTRLSNFLVVFVATTSAGGRELWRSDGTLTGTFEITIAPGDADSRPTFFGVVGGSMLFSADDGTSGRELWTTDGSTASLVRDIDSGAGESGISSSSTLPFATHAGNAWFEADDGSGDGVSLWKSDGTLAGTVLASTAPSSIDEFVSAGNRLYFSAFDSTHGRELWAINPTGTTVQLVEDIDGTAASSLDDDFTGFPGPSGSLLVGVLDGPGRQLWRTTGAPNSAQQITLATEPLSSSVRDLTPFRGGIAGRVGDGLAEAQLLVSDGTPVGTSVESFVNPLGDFRYELAAWNDELYLESNRSSGVPEALWKWSPESGPLELGEAGGDINELFANPSGVAWVGDDDRIYFTDGTAVGDTSLLEISSAPDADGLSVFGADQVYYGSGIELWRTDLATQASELVAEVLPEGWFGPDPRVRNGSRVYFSASSPSDASLRETEIWMAQDGMTGATKLLTLPFSSIGMTAYGDEVAILSWTPEGDWQLHRSDGTVAGTQFVAAGTEDIFGSNFFGRRPIVAGAGLVFWERDLPNLWRSDGTTAGTVAVPDTRDFFPLLSFGEWVLVQGTRAATGREFLLLHPITGELRPLPEIEAGPAGTLRIDVELSAGTLYASVWRSDVGLELFSLDLDFWLNGMFGDGFESSDTSAWSAAVP